MGEAKLKEAEVASINAKLNGAPQTQLQAADFMVVLALDLAVHHLQGVGSQLAAAIGNKEAANEVAKSIEHLINYRTRYVAQKSAGIVIAQPSDLPRQVT